ncbi:MAG: transcriptional regulator [Nevskia sp.]|nr:transcriptional regulator [Nevskia sp.]
MSPAELPGLLDAADPVLEHRVRLAACVLLSGTEEISFARFKELLRQTDGNLGAQLRKLEDAGYIVAHKMFQERKPVTWYRLTATGRQALARHLQHLQRLVAQAVV